MLIYIASPFFSEEEFNRVTEMEKFLELRGYKVYSPKRDGIMLTKDASQEDRLKVFKENVENVRKCDLMITIVSTPDTGTSVELGMKYMQWKDKYEELLEISENDPSVLSSQDKIILNQESPRIITFSDNGKKVNVMLLGAVLCHCGSWKELSDYLDYVDKVGIENAKRDMNSITNVNVF